MIGAPRTADFFHFDLDFLGRVANRIVNEVRGINRVAYDVISTIRDDRAGSRALARLGRGDVARGADQKPLFEFADRMAERGRRNAQLRCGPRETALSPYGQEGREVVSLRGACMASAYSPLRILAAIATAAHSKSGQATAPGAAACDATGDQAMASFDADTLDELRHLQEVRSGPGASQDAVVIWVAVADDEVFVRSVRGTKGRWYRDLAAGGPATLEFAGRRLAVQAIPASDPAAIGRASREYLRKYRPSPMRRRW